MLALKELVENGSEGMCISIDFPGKLKERYGLPDEKIFYIQLQKGKYTYGTKYSVQYAQCSPGNLSSLSTKIGDYLKDSTRPVVILHGLQSITMHNDISKTISFIEWIEGKVHDKDGYFIASISDTEFSEEDLGKIKGYFDEVITDSRG